MQEDYTRVKDSTEMGRLSSDSEICSYEEDATRR